MKSTYRANKRGLCNGRLESGFPACHSRAQDSRDQNQIQYPSFRLMDGRAGDCAVAPGCDLFFGQ